MNKNDLLRRFLNVYWLRPEHALWFAYDYMAIDKVRGMFRSPSLDLGCGDGVTSFLFMDGVFGPGFDVYKTVDHDVSYRYNRGKDDFYDAFDPDSFASLDVVSPPALIYDAGLDHKPGLTAKAFRLGLYRNMICADANKTLPYPEASFATVFSNILYLLQNFSSALHEIHRILKPGGVLITTVPDRRFRERSLYSYCKSKNWDWFVHFDRGRHDLHKTVLTHEGYTNAFQAAGFEVNYWDCYLPEIVTDVDSIGLRPIFPSLMKFYEYVASRDATALLEIKSFWIENLSFLLDPFLQDWVAQDKDISNIWHLYVLRKPN